MWKPIAACITAALLTSTFSPGPATAMSCTERFEQCTAVCVPLGDGQAACQSRCERGRSYCLSLGCWHGRNRQTVCGFARN